MEPFLDLQDTPVFHQTVQELQGSAKKLKERLKGLLGAARKYRDALASMTTAHGAFASALADFGCGSDEESLLMGSAVTCQFVKAFRELAYAWEFISECVDKDLIAPLQDTWLDGHLASLREEGKRHDKRCADHEAARLKHLGLKKVVRREVLERSGAELAAARGAADEARFELARHLHTVEVAKRHEFLALLVGCVAQHLAFFRQGAALLGRTEGPYSDAMAISDHLRKEGAAKQAALEEVIRATREQAAAREAAIAHEAAAAAGSEAGASSAGGSSAAEAAADSGAAAGQAAGSAPLQGQLPAILTGAAARSPRVSSSASPSGGNSGAGAVHTPTAGGSSGVAFPLGGAGVAATALISATPGGPVQLTSAAAGLLAEVAALVGATQQSGGQRVVVIKQGFLSKRSQNASLKGSHQYKQRFFVLDSIGCCYYYSHRADGSSGSLGSLVGRASGTAAAAAAAKPKNTLPLLTSTVKMDSEDAGMRCCFRLVSPEGTYTLQAASEWERAEWVAALQGVISVLLSGSVDLAALPRVPLRPTHSRHNSLSDTSLGLLQATSPLAGGGGGSSCGGSQPGTPTTALLLDPVDGSHRVSSSGGGMMPPSTSSPAAAGAGCGAASSSLPPSPLGRLAPEEGTTSSNGVGGAADQAAPPGGQATPSAAASGSLHQPPQQQQQAQTFLSQRQHSSQQQQDGALTTQQQQQQRLSEATASPGGAAGDSRTSGCGSGTLLERLRRLPGNRACADCGAPDPDWASLNLGVLLCIECSGVHRQLGVQVSKVRSTTLDVKDWREPVPALFEALGGNDAVNGVWEAALLAGQQQEVGTGVASHGGQQQSPPAAAPATAAAAKSSPSAPAAHKQRFIEDKYAARRFVAPPPSKQAAQALLWDAVDAHDARAALAALAGGADVNAAYRTPRAHKLVTAALSRARPLSPTRQQQQEQSQQTGGSTTADGAPDTPSRWPACGGVSVLHAAAASGDVLLLELLLLNGASWAALDGGGHSPLHYALLHDACNCAKALLRRGGSALAALTDGQGRTALELVLATKGRVADEELFVLLATGTDGKA